MEAFLLFQCITFQSHIRFARNVQKYDDAFLNSLVYLYEKMKGRVYFNGQFFYTTARSNAIVKFECDR